MIVVLLVVLSIAGLFWNTRATRAWWRSQKSHLPKVSDLFGWAGVGLSALWYLFVYAFFIGLTVNNTLFR